MPALTDEEVGLAPAAAPRALTDADVGLAPSAPEAPRALSDEDVGLAPASNSIDAFRSDPENQAAARRILRTRTGRDIEGAAAVRELETDMGWADANTASAVREYAQSGGTERMRADQARLRSRWNDVPWFWQSGGRGLYGLGQTLTAGVLDPVNLVGGPLTKGAAALATRVGLGGLGRALTTQGGRIAGTAAIDAAGGAGANLTQQATENELGLREGYSLGEAGLAGAVSGVASGAGNALFNRPSRRTTPDLGTPEANAMRANKTGPDVDSPEHGTNLNWVQQRYQRFVDATLPAAKMAKVRGTGDNIRDMSRNTRAGQVDPSASAYGQLRGMPGSAERARQFSDEDTFLPAENGALAGTPESGFGRKIGDGINRIFADLEKKYGVTREQVIEVNDAARAIYLRDRRNPHLMAEAFDNVLRQTDDYKRIFNGSNDTTALNFVRLNATPGTSLHTAATKAAEAAKIGLGKYDDASAHLPGMTGRGAKATAAGSPDAILAQARQQPWFTEAFDRTQKFWDDSLEYAVSSGMLSRQGKDAMQGAGIPNPQDIPFAYSPWLHEGSAQGGGSGGAMGVTSSVKQKLTGNMGNLMDPQARIEAYVSRLIASADMNRAKHAYVDEALAIQSDPKLLADLGGKMILRRVHDTQAAEALAREDAAKALQRLGLPPSAATELDMLQASILAERRGGASSGETSRVSFYRDGKLEVYEILDPAHTAMFEALAPENLKQFWQAVRGFGRLKSDLITNAPPFIFWNMFKDTVSAGINSPHGFKAFSDTGRGLLELARSTRLNPNEVSRKQTRDFILEARRSGVGFAGRNHLTQIAESGGDFTRANRDGVYGSIRDWMADSRLGRGWAAWAELVNQLEMAPRLIEYKRAREAGMTGLGAGLAGREVATDFARRGSSQGFRQFAGMTTFLNASLQGMDRTWRAVIKEKSVAKLGIAFTAFVLPPLVLHTLNAGHETYDGFNEDQRRQSAWLPNPADWGEYFAWLRGEKNEFDWGDGIVHRSPKAKFIAVPLPEAVAGVVSAVNGVLDAIRTSNGEEAARGVWNGLLANMPGVHAPDLAEPFIQVFGTGRDGLGRPITPPGVAGMDPANERKPDTPQWAVDAVGLFKKITGGALGEGREGLVPLTPIELDFIAKSFLPGVGTILMQTGSQLTRNPVREGERTEARAEEYDASNPLSMITRRFVREPNAPSNEQLNKLYRLAARAAEVEKAEQNAYRDPVSLRRDGTRARPTTDERAALLAMAPALRGVQQAVSSFRTGMALIDSSTNRSPAERRRQMDRLVARRDKAVNTAMEMIRKRQPVLFRSRLNPNPERDTPDANLVRSMFGRGRTEN